MNLSDWSVDDVCNFIESLSLHSLSSNFRENGVDGKDLLGMTDEELKGDLGCTGLQLKKIRNALATASATPTAARAVPPTAARAVPPTDASAVPALAAVPGTAALASTTESKVAAKPQCLVVSEADLRAQRNLVENLQENVAMQQEQIALAEKDASKEGAKVDKYTREKYFPGKHLVGKSKAKEHGAKQHSAQTKTSAAEYALASAQEALAEAQARLEAMTVSEGEAVASTKQGTGPGAVQMEAHAHVV